MFRPTQDTAMLILDFVYETITLYGRPFQSIQLSVTIQYRSPTTPSASTWFALIHVRSPLLAESLLISLPLATEMFHFTRLAPRRVTYFTVCWVVPFGNLWIKAS